jgi:methionyl-tRNA formyltransferase
MGLRLAIFGQAPFGRDVTARLAEAGHEVVGVYAPPDGARPDPLAALAQERGWKLFRHARFRRQGAAIPELVDEYRALGAELNVLPFTTVILPPEITELPKHGSICFHPSLLPRYRGGAALAWQIMLGERETGVSVFHVTAGVDEGPLVVQKGGVEISDSDTAASLYFEKLYPLGVDAVVEAVERIAAGTAVYAPQPESGASFQGLVDDAAARIDWARPARELDRQIRGCDPSPGALALHDGVEVRLFDSRLVADGAGPGVLSGSVLEVAGERVLVAGGGGRLSIGKLRVGTGKKVAAALAGVAPGARLT